MQLTVKQLIDKLEGFPLNAWMSIRDVEDEHEEFTISRLEPLRLSPGQAVTSVDLVIRRKDKPDED